MKSILIDHEFFNLENPKSVGLVSGLKKISENGFKIYIENPSRIPKELISVFKSEKIQFKKHNAGNDVITKRIMTKGNSSDTNIVVGSNGIKSFYDAASLISSPVRKSNIVRTTKETKINININLDGNGKGKINTGIGFFDHMLEQISRHSNLDLSISVKGDLNVDEHHTVEDTGIALGEAISKALGSKIGIKRYGFLLPMDEAHSVCAIDIGGRNHLNFNCRFNREFVGGFPTELTKEFFRGLASGMRSNIFIKAAGENDHHKIEAIFKSFAKALNEACRMDERALNSLPSTKGIL